MDNVLSSGVSRAWKRVTIVGGPDTASMCRDEETPDYNAPTEARNISACIHGNDYVDTRRAIGSYNHAHICREGGRAARAIGSQISRDSTCHEKLTLIFIDSRGHVIEVSSKVFRRFNRSHVLTVRKRRSPFIFRIVVSDRRLARVEIRKELASDCFLLRVFRLRYIFFSTMKI